MAKDFSKAKASSTLKSVAEKSRMLSNTKVIVKLPVDKLLDHPDNEYLFGMKQEDIDYMAEGIAQNGFKDPIEVYDNQDGTYMIYSGHIRKYGAIKNGMTEIDAIVYEKPEENVIRRELLGANLFGRNRIDNSDPILVARQLEYHTETLGLEGFQGNRRKQVAKEFGFKSDANVHKYVALLSLIPELQKKVSERSVSYSGISAAAQMTAEEQKLLNERLEEKLSMDTVTRTEIENMIKDIQNGGDDDQLEGQFEVADYPELLPEEEKEHTYKETVSKEPEIKEERNTQKVNAPQMADAKEKEEYRESYVQSEEKIKDNNEKDISDEVVHGEQQKAEEKAKQNTESKKDNKGTDAGGMLDVYMKNIEKIFEKHEVIQYENMEKSLGIMKVVKMLLEDEIDRLSDIAV